MKFKIFCLGAVALALLGAATSVLADPDAINYGALNNTNYTYTDLIIAKTRDFSDTTIAKLVKISEESGTPFSVLSDRLEIGATFVSLADRYGVPIADLSHVQAQKDEVANYMSAYETSGNNAFPDSNPLQKSY
jgi:hypothetical protein